MKLHKITLKILCALLVLSGTTFARSLSQYKQGINNVRQFLAVIIYPDGEQTEAGQIEVKEAFFDNLQNYIPPKEKIEIQGATVETDNRWLYDKLEKYKENSKANLEDSSDKQKLILNDIYERLTAIELEVEELETAAAGEATKDANKRKLSEILSRDEFLKPKPPEENIFQRTYRKIMEWLDSMFPKPEFGDGSTFESLGAIANVVKYLIFALIFGIIGFVIYKFLPPLLDKYKLREKREKKDRVIMGEKIASDATAQSLFGDAENLAKQGDLRGAIRKGYIALLCELDDRQIVRLSKDKTNRDYLRDVRRKDEKIYAPMNGLTNNFERHWYGFEEADETNWEEFRSGYKEVVNS